MHIFMICFVTNDNYLYSECVLCCTRSTNLSFLYEINYSLTQADSVTFSKQEFIVKDLDNIYMIGFQSENFNLFRVVHDQS